MNQIDPYKKAARDRKACAKAVAEGGMMYWSNRGKLITQEEALANCPWTLADMERAEGQGVQLV